MTLFRQSRDGTIKVALQKSLMTLIRQNSEVDCQSGTSKFQQKINNRQHIQENIEIAHNLNIKLSNLNITNSTISVFSD